MAEWFERWFGDDYLALYPHRNEADAERLVQLILAEVPARTISRLLDIACGPGRHLAAFSEAGAPGIGADLSMALLRQARQVTTAPLVRTDMRALPFRDAVADLTVNLFTSFGYFETDAEHRLALREMTRTLKPGGWFVIDFLNATRVRASLVPAETTELNGTAVQIARTLEQDGAFVRKTIVAADGRRWEERVRLLSMQDLEAWLADAGVTIVRRFGDYDGAEPGPAAPRVILLAVRS